MTEGRLPNGDVFSFLKSLENLEISQDNSILQRTQGKTFTTTRCETSKLLNELSNARKPLHVSVGKFPSRVSVLVPRSLGNFVSNLRHLKMSNTFQGH